MFISYLLKCIISYSGPETDAEAEAPLLWPPDVKQALASVFLGASRKVSTHTVPWEQGLFCFLRTTPGRQTAIFLRLTGAEG